MGFLLFLLVIIGIIAFKTIKIVKQSEVYVIERLGKFYKTISDDTCFLVPLIDNVKNIVNLEGLVQETEIAKTFLPNDNEIYFKFKICSFVNQITITNNSNPIWINQTL